MTSTTAEKPRAGRAAIGKHIAWLAPLALLGALVLLTFVGEEIVLRSLDRTDVLSAFEEKAGLRTVIAVLKPGEKVQVLGCESIKSDVEIRVRLPSGETGFVAVGNYRLERRHASLESIMSPRSIVFSCRGMLAPISEPYSR